MMILVDAVLGCIVLILLYPGPLSMALKRVALLIGAMGAIFCVMLVLRMNGERTITITALDQKNEAAEGSEIVVIGVRVDKTEYPAAEIFSQGWINEDGTLRWRNYDQIPDMKKTISARLPAKSNVDILFETNKWRGIVQIEEENLISIEYRVDCYSDNSEVRNILSYLSAKKLSDLRVSGLILFFCLFGILAIFVTEFCGLLGQKEADNKDITSSIKFR